MIADLTGTETVSRGAGRIIDGWLRSGRNQAIVSAATIMETPVRALDRLPPEGEAIVTFFEQWPNLTVVDVDTLVARAAAGLLDGASRRRLP